MATQLDHMQGKYYCSPRVSIALDSFHPKPALFNFSFITLSCLLILQVNLCFKRCNHRTYSLYGLQAAINLKKGGTDLPRHLPSHITSFIRLITSLVLASSKNTTVSIPNFLFSSAFLSAASMHLITSDSVVPPWI